MKTSFLEQTGASRCDLGLQIEALEQWPGF
jgi:hypothetical protein